MDRLLKAMQEDDEEAVNALACELFITSSGQHNQAQINEFERFAPCRIYPVERDSYGWLIGGITYNDKKFTFG